MRTRIVTLYINSISIYWLFSKFMTTTTTTTPSPITIIINKYINYKKEYNKQEVKKYKGKWSDIISILVLFITL